MFFYFFIFLWHNLVSRKGTWQICPLWHHSPSCLCWQHKWEDIKIRNPSKHRHTLSETYVHLTPLSDVWHFSSITVMTDPSSGLGVARSNMEKFTTATAQQEKIKSWITFLLYCSRLYTTRTVLFCQLWHILYSNNGHIVHFVVSFSEALAICLFPWHIQAAH